MMSEPEFTIFDFFAECPDIRAPKSMADLPRYSDALRRAGHFEWARTFMEWYARFCEAIIQETTVVDTRISEDA